MAWEQFWTLSKLDVVVTGAQQSDAAKIYANGRNLVQAIITVQLLDKSGQAINVSDADLHAALYMCHFETGEKLSSSWLIANDPNDYVIQPTAPRENPPVGANVRQISKYIGCSDQNLIEITQKIAVGINVPNVGEFDTSSNGTSTRAPSGQVFKSPKSVSITALRPIDYRNHNNIQIVCGEFDTLRSNLQWVARFSTAGPFYDHTDAECKRRIAYIRPNKANTGQEKFKEHSIEYKPVGNGDVSTGTCEWYWDTGSEATFSVVKQAGGVGLPGAVIGRGAGRGDFQGIYTKSNFDENLLVINVCLTLFFSFLHFISII